MQYKIPVHIENEDPILLGLGLKQLGVIMGGLGLAYGIFKSLSPFGQDIALIPSVIVAGLGILIALFKQYEMTFLPFLLALLRMNINPKERYWIKGVDNFSPLEIGNVILTEKVENDSINFDDKNEKIQNLENSLNKL